MKKSEVNRLTLSYLAVIMTLSLIFTGIIYLLSTASLNRPLLPSEEENSSVSVEAPEFGEHSFENTFRKRLERRDNTTRMTIIYSLVGFNLGIFVIGIFVSRSLAKLTLAPIERAMMKQTQFIFDASHELKTPLTAMLVRNEVALRKKSLPEEKAREVIEKNIEEILKMKELTASMLAVARENGEPEKLTEISVPEFLADLQEKLAPVAKERGVKIEAEMNLGKNLRVSVAKNTLEQILTIFADNAMKYSGEKIIYLRAGRRGKNVAFSVKDNGAGVKKEDQKRIFERFYQVDAARTRTEDKTSYGLGLAIAKNLAERQGYKIVLRSSEGRGAEFEVVV
ncbi:HAMP domain-containing histidine kinase [TM7 phylum sp. oral taxon 351]|nr:HAMP domain-containing histidine kinase [TM7 phylum sp. oral taxon 351]